MQCRLSAEVERLRLAQEAGVAQAHQHFHERLAAATALAAPPRSRTGRWLWRGSVAGGGAHVEAAVLDWASEAVAAADVLAWAKGDGGDPAVITALVPGLFRVSAAVFTGSAAVVGMEVLVDGAVAVRSGGGSALGTGTPCHPLGNVAARVALDGVLSLPAGAAVSVRVVVAGGASGRERSGQAYVELTKM